jgi:DNA polymerase IV
MHVDMDAFYVSVELLRRPDLRGRPVVVGGEAGRGVVAAASYEARRYGVRSAMSSGEARRRCPQAVFLPADHRRYAEVSHEIRSVFSSHTDLVEPLALDEAFLDVSHLAGGRGPGGAVDVATAIRAEVAERTGLMCSIGLAANKFVAKLASVEAKPVAERAGVRPGPGVVVVAAGTEADFVGALPVDRLWGVGPRTAERLAAIGIRTVAALIDAHPSVLEHAVGHHAAAHLARLALGEDDRPVESDREPKSIGHEETFESDIVTLEDLRAEFWRMVDLVAGRVRSHQGGARTWTAKIRFPDFRTVTRSVTVTASTATPGEVDELLWPVVIAAVGSRSVRLLGVSASQFAAPVRQLDLFDASIETADRALGVVDEVRARFGQAAIGFAGARRADRGPASGREPGQGSPDAAPR